MNIADINVTDKYLDKLFEISNKLGVDFSEMRNGKAPSIKETFDYIFSQFSVEVSTYLKLLSIFIVVIIISSLIGQISENATQPVYFVTCVTIIYFTLSSGIFDYDYMFSGIGLISEFVSAYIPIFTTIFALSGNLTLSGVYGGIALFCAEIFSKINLKIVVPFINLMISIGIITSIGNDESNKIISSLKKFLIYIETAMSGILMSIMTINGFVAKSTDTIIFKGGKALSGAAIPVIGSTLSSSYETVVACFSSASGIVGSVGMISLVCIAAPFIVRICLSIFVMFVGELIADVMQVWKIGKVFSIFKSVSILALSSYAFELLVLVMGISLMMVVGQ